MKKGSQSICLLFPTQGQRAPMKKKRLYILSQTINVLYTSLLRWMTWIRESVKRLTCLGPKLRGFYLVLLVEHLLKQFPLCLPEQLMIAAF